MSNSLSKLKYLFSSSSFSLFFFCLRGTGNRRTQLTVSKKMEIALWWTGITLQSMNLSQPRFILTGGGLDLKRTFKRQNRGDRIHVRKNSFPYYRFNRLFPLLPDVFDTHKRRLPIKSDAGSHYHYGIAAKLSRVGFPQLRQPARINELDA